MKTLIQTPKAIAPVRDSLKRSSWRRGILLIPVALSVSFCALSSGIGASCEQDCDTSNTALGWSALINNSNYGNTAVGSFALEDNTTGGSNSAVGNNALINNTTGSYNTACGVAALAGPYSGEETGNYNSAYGYAALSANASGSDNTATGAYALYSNTTASKNTATGYTALFTNTTGGSNTADGFAALYGNTTGNYNTADGYAALYGNTTGGYNTASGYAVLYKNTTGGNNTGAGFKALFSNTTGTGNTADGLNALYNNTTGSNNIALGNGAGLNLTTGSYNIDIGNAGVAGEANTIRIGKVGTQTNTYIAGIYGVTASSGVGVFIDSNGHLGTATSSERFKDQIKPMDKASEAILALQPVTFRYKAKLDPEGIPQFGLVAEQVAKVNPDLVARDEQGKPYTVRYEAVNAMLLNEFLKEHRIVEGLKTTVAEQQKEIAALIVALKEQAAQTQTVREELQGDAAGATPRDKRLGLSIALINLWQNLVHSA